MMSPFSILFLHGHTSLSPAVKGLVPRTQIPSASTLTPIKFPHGTRALGFTTSTLTVLIGMYPNKESSKSSFVSFLAANGHLNNYSSVVP